jgi:hypothetical protein
LGHFRPSPPVLPAGPLPLRPESGLLRLHDAISGVEGIIEAGLLIEAKSELEHGQFSDWVVRDLRFGTRKDGSRETDLRKAEMLMFLREMTGFKPVSVARLSAVSPYAAPAGWTLK